MPGRYIIVLWLCLVFPIMLFAKIPVHSDCAIRRLALEFAQQQLLSPSFFPAVFDGLELSTRCNDTRPSIHDSAVPSRAQISLPAQSSNTIYVDYEHGSDSNPGTLLLPVKTAAKGLDLLRRKDLAEGISKSLVLRSGVHFLNETLRLQHIDSGLTIQGYPGDELPWFSGGLPLVNLKWIRSSGKNNVYEADLQKALARDGGQKLTQDIHSLRLNNNRATAARFPNADIERDSFPTGYVMKAQSWLPPKTYEPAKRVKISKPNRANISNIFQYYQAGIGGPCSIFDPPVSFWCNGKTGFTPSGLQMLNSTQVKNWSNPIGDGAEVFVWRPHHWNNWMFNMDHYDAATRTIKFGLGGFQGTRPNPAGQEYYISHVREELDSPNEFFIDKKAKKLFYFPNSTSPDARPPSNGFVLTRIRNLLSINGNKTQPIRNIRITGVGFRDARATYMDPHGVPSAGDWALQRSGAIFLDGTEDVTIANVTMERNDGNAIMISGFNVKATVTGCNIRWTGDTAIAIWGRTDELSANGTRGMFANGDHPINSEISHNMIHELGAFEKQSSMVFIAKSCGTYIHNNVFFNGPRAGINVNDGFCGGHRIHSNIIFNTCRESGDHGPFNSWDRQPFAMKSDSLPVPAITEISGNFLFGDYDGVKAIDHDDGSSFYNDHTNVIYMGWGQKTFKPAPGEKRTWNSLILFPTSVLTEHGGEINSSFSEHFYNNTIVFDPASANYGVINKMAQIQHHLLQLHSNHFFTANLSLEITVEKKTLTLEQLQATGAEVNSSLIKNIPTDTKLVAMARELLRFK